MSQITLHTLVADIVTAIPETADLFRKLRIDFCCGGKIPLEEAARNLNLDGEQVLSKILYIEQKHKDYAEHQPAAELDEKELINHIQQKHHAYLREELPQLTPYITKVARVHGENHPHLLRVQEIYGLLKRELLEHTEDEDQIVFPLIMHFADHPTAEAAEALKPHVMELEGEHEHAGDLLKELRKITCDFEPPAGACGTYRLVYQRLAQLEKDTFEHIHLENNVLFEKVRAAM
ncbi:iron-sulfur cluster repair di-iron protein [Paenibacillus dakarensis]|uniref:iron-sulfur cluster repair di-iron protein n=1 Tax=Paenibacillus dakarensis TaxID=1527293 RepID=UPI0006D530CA|nr:iron-sulfur cluster repair di-iron protein [Paenibacillus dakarensis]